MKIALTLGLIVLVVVAVVVILNRKSGEKYEWLPTESAFSKFPMRIVKGDLFLQDGSSIYIPDRRTVKNGWGEIGSTHGVGEAQKALPVKLSITWFSYLEDKFYTGEFDLPVERIQQLFKEGVIDQKTGKHESYWIVAVGMAPEGNIAVWLKAIAGVNLQIAEFQASEAQVDWKQVLDNPEITRQQFINDVLSEALSPDEIIASRESISSGEWRKYTHQYPWSPEVVGTTPDEIFVRSFNGEIDHMGSSPSSDRREKRGVPSFVSVNWSNRDGDDFTTTIQFDEDEIFSAFSEFQVTEPDAPLKLLVEIDRETGKVGVSLRSADRTVRLEKSVIERYITNSN